MSDLHPQYDPPSTTETFVALAFVWLSVLGVVVALLR
jgi:TRAP-type C4-dicarboxylate transport system permease small subunit